ncbi:MAG: ABC transporter ATP-binding protein, partial [Pseudomonadota bacterium]
LGLATMKGANLLILDEPTNHLDIDSRTALMEAINAYDGAVVLISHDRYLVEACVDRLWLVAEGTVVPFEGDMDEYRDLILASARKSKAERGAEKTKPSQQDKRREAAAARAALAPIRKRIKEAERALEQAETEIAKREAVLSDPALYTADPQKATRLSTERARWLEKREAAEEAWLSASEEYEGAEALGSADNSLGLTGQGSGS